MISFVAALVVIIILICFMIAAISHLKSEVDKQIHQDIYRLSSVYYPIIDAKSEELKNIKEEIKQLKEIEGEFQNAKGEHIQPQCSHVFIQEQGNYLDSNFFEMYGYVQNEFQSLAKETMKMRVNQLVHQRRDINVHEFKELLEIFDYAIQYEMHTLSSEAQLKVFEVISMNSIAKKRILKRYVENHEHFEFKAFMDYVRDYIYRHDGTVYVYGRNFEGIDVDQRYVVLCQDESITEGYKVKYKDYVYDYSLSSGGVL